MRAEANAYSPQWFEFFYIGISEARTRQETEFICRCAHLPTFRKALDACCGVGRHARALSKRLWSAEFFVAHQGRYEFETPGGVVRETKRIEEDRLFVYPDYPDGGEDNFEWQLFSPAQMISMAESVGLRQLLACTDFDEATPPSPSNPRIQFLFERYRA